MKTSRLLLSTLLVVAAPLLADTRWPIALPDRTRDELIALPLTPPVFAAGQIDAATLRVRDAAATEIPSLYEPLWIVGRERRRIETGPFEIIRAETPGKALRLTLRRPLPTAGDETALEGLSVSTGLRDFEQQVLVEASDDGETWLPVVRNAVLFDLSRHAAVRRTEFALPAGMTRQWLRLTFEQAIDTREQLTALVTDTRQSDGGNSQTRAVQVDTRPFHVDAVSGWIYRLVDQPRRPQQMAYPVVWTPKTSGVPAGKTVYEIKADGAPLTSMTIDLPTDFASWTYTLAAEQRLGVETRTRPIAQGTLSQFRFRETTEKHTTIAFAETRAARYVLTIDRPAAPITAIRAEGPCYRLVFPAAKSVVYTLDHLDEPTAATAATGDISRLLSQGVQPLNGTIQTDWPDIVRPPFWQGRLQRLLLPGGIVLALLALVFSLVKAVKKIEVDA